MIGCAPAPMLTSWELGQLLTFPTRLPVQWTNWRTISGALIPTVLVYNDSLIASIDEVIFLVVQKDASLCPESVSYLSFLNLLGWYWLITLYKCQLYNSVTHYLYIALCTQNSKDSLPLSPYIWPPLRSSSSTQLPSPLVPAFCCLCLGKLSILVHLFAWIQFFHHSLLLFVVVNQISWIFWLLQLILVFNSSEFLWH